MFYNFNGNVISVRLEIDEEIISSVEKICKKENIKSAVVHAIGAVKRAKIAMFDFATGNYKENALNEFMELISLEGNITKMNGEVYSHFHACFGDEEGRAFGGHLKEAVIGATCELFIIPLENEIPRFHDDETGLNLIDT